MPLAEITDARLPLVELSRHDDLGERVAEGRTIESQIEIVESALLARATEPDPQIDFAIERLTGAPHPRFADPLPATRGEVAGRALASRSGERVARSAG